MSTRTLRLLTASLVALLAATIGVRVSLPAKASAAIDCSKIARESASRNHVVTHRGTERVIVLGDSYAQGYGLKHQSDSWPAYLPATVTVRSLGGTGFAASPCGTHDAYRYRAENLPAADLVIVEGGLNDVVAADAAIESGLRATVSETGAARTVIVGPVNAPKWSARAEHVDQLLEKVCAELGVRYVSTYAVGLNFGPDQVHLAGRADHRMLAEVVADALS